MNSTTNLDINSATLQGLSCSDVSPNGISVSTTSSSRKTTELKDMSDWDYFRHTPWELLNKSTEFNVENLTREYIVPKIKFVSDTDKEWKWPDLEDTDLNSTSIMNILLPKLGDVRNDPKYKMDFWTTYRKCIKKILNDHRSNLREKMKKLVLEGKN